MTQPNYYGQYAQTLVANGYQIVPIPEGSKGCKVPHWPERTFTHQDAVQYSGFGVGIKTGTGQIPIVGFDIDVSHDGLLAAYLEWCKYHLGGTLERVGATGLCLVFRAEQAGWGKLTSASFFDPSNPTKPNGRPNDQRVEVLGKGNQFVAYHTHPDTHEPYDWQDGWGGIMRVSADRLPVVSYRKIQEALVEFERLASKFPELQHKASGVESPPHKELTFADVALTIAPLGVSDDQIRIWLASVSPDCDRHTWINDVGMGLHHETGGAERGFQLWYNWSQGAPEGKRASESEMRYQWSKLGSRPVGPRVKTIRWLRKRNEAPELYDPAAKPLGSKDYLGAAEAFADRLYQDADGVRTLVHYKGVWYKYRDGCYREIDKSQIDAQMWLFLSAAVRVGPAQPGSAGVTLVPYRPTATDVSAAIAALRALVAQSGEVDAPLWMEGYSGPPAHEMVALQNGLLHLPTRELRPLTPGFLSMFALPYLWDADAKCDNWLTFLDQVWPNDPQAISTLQEMFGYLLTSDTSQQKMFMLEGAKRSGKGTIGRVLGELLGTANVAPQSLGGLTGDFGLMPVVDKLVCLIADARGSVPANVVEKLLTISGEDRMAINRKSLAFWTGKMTARVVILTNETPSFNDSSGALADRFITFKMRQSFYGREDTRLTERLIAELPGILSWALVGRDRLLARGRFVNPESGQAVTESMKDEASPVASFVGEVCTLASSVEVSSQVLFDAWTAWCLKNGIKPISKPVFSKRLLAAFPSVRVQRAGGARGNVSYYLGVNLAISAAPPPTHH